MRQVYETALKPFVVLPLHSASTLQHKFLFPFLLPNASMATVPFTLHLCRFGRNLLRNTLSPTSSITRFNPRLVNFRRKIRRRISFSASTFSHRFSTVSASSSSRGMRISFSSFFLALECRFFFKIEIVRLFVFLFFHI